MGTAVWIRAGLAAVLLPAYAWAGEGSGDSAARVPEGAASTLTIRSEPPGAEVTVDGIRVGAAPVKVDSLPPGTHRLQLSLDGYLTKAASVKLAGGADEVSFTLVKPGALTVVADVPGAGVWLDSLYLGTAPADKGGLKPGQYTVRASKPGHTDFSAAVTVAAGGRDTVRAVLPAAPAALPAVKPAPVAASRTSSFGGRRAATIAACIAFTVFSGIVIAVDAASD